MKKILVVEDDIEISKMEKTLLERNGYQTKSAYSGTEALLLLERETFDLILLDLMLPGLSGEEVLLEIRRKVDTPVICVSAKDDMHTKLEVIRNGADDYMTKPFDNEELLVRIAALLRRTQRNKGNGDYNINLNYKDLMLNTENYTVEVSNTLVELTNKEYGILQLLMENPKKVFTKENIFESVWQEESMSEDNAVSVHVSNLRNKLAIANSQEKYIKTVWGIGFKMHEY